MARSKKTSPENHERWLISYADFITLLFAFFVVMFASAQTDKTKSKQVSDSVGEALENGGITATFEQLLSSPVNWKSNTDDQMRQQTAAQKTKQTAEAELLPSLHLLSQKLREEIRSGKVQVRVEPRGLVVSLQQVAFFSSGGDTMDASRFSSVAKVAAVLRDLPNAVRLEGHTDSVPIHTTRFRNNWELSMARSITMLDLLSTRFAIPAERFVVAGYADVAPVASNDTEEGRARNRRVDIVVLNRLIALDTDANIATAKGD